MPVFRGCGRLLIWRLARWGDVVEARPGDVLVREDHTDHWFFVVLQGSVRVTRGGEAVVNLGRGGHFGELAIIGFRPQPATVVAAEPTVLFVLGRRYLLSLASTDHTIQRALFPDVEPAEYRAFARELQEQGHVEWERLKPRYTRDRRVTVPRRPGRPLSWGEALALLSAKDPGHDLAVPSRPAVQPRRPVPKQVRRALAAGAALLLTAIALLYHPPVAVVSAGPPVDVVEDIAISGASFDAPTGRYILTSVKVDRHNLLRTALAWARGRNVVPARSFATPGIDPETARLLGQEAFLRSHRQAISLAEATVHANAEALTIVIRDRGLTGPSAGLLYALAIVDILDPADLAAGRVIAATGVLEEDGRVSAVGFVSVKADAARRGGATIFLVPAFQENQVGGTGLLIFGVGSLEEALEVLKESA